MRQGPNCERCGEIIDPDRIDNARQRGHTARYCSLQCGDAARSATYYAANAASIASRRKRSRDRKPKQ